jgi:catechol 2,3-dioxygenase-like lactoylglutathione lyase family enzyme
MTQRLDTHARLCAACPHDIHIGGTLKVQRIVTNVKAPDPALAEKFYAQIFGLDLLMDMGWIRTYGGKAKMSVQISFMSEGGAGTPVPDVSIEVDDLETALERCKAAGVAIEYGPVAEPWGVRRFFVRDPFGQLVNVLSH